MIVLAWSLTALAILVVGGLLALGIELNRRDYRDRDRAALGGTVVALPVEPDGELLRAGSASLRNKRYFEAPARTLSAQACQLNVQTTGGPRCWTSSRTIATVGGRRGEARRSPSPCSRPSPSPSRG